MNPATEQGLHATAAGRMRCERCDRRAHASSLQAVEGACSCWVCLTGEERARILDELHALN